MFFLIDEQPMVSKAAASYRYAVLLTLITQINLLMPGCYLETMFRPKRWSLAVLLMYFIYNSGLFFASK